MVLTTAYPQYALEGFQLDVLDYLLKPITFERFYQAANRAKDYYTIQQKAQGVVRQHAIADIVETPDHFFVKVDNKYERIDVQNILYVEGMQNYVKIHTKGQEYMTLLTLKSVKEKLSSDQFMRIHKSYLVAKDKVMAMEGNQLVVGKDKLTISRNYRDEVKRRLLQENLLNGKK